MNQSAQKTHRHWLVVMVGTVLLAGGLLALALPVFLDDYDTWGIQVRCGNGYHSQLLEGTVNHQNPGRQATPGSAPAANYVDQCKSAVAHRRAWAAPAAGLGALLLIPRVVAWVRKTTPESGSPTSTSTWSAAEHPDAVMHEAAVMDRRGTSHRDRPSGTTL